MIVPNKAKMYELFQDGAFGNRVRNWMSFADYERDGKPCNVGIRYKNPGGGGGPFVPDIEPRMVSTNMLYLIAQGWDARYMVLGEATPNERIILQGEICQDDARGYALHYSTVKKSMRCALKEAPRDHLGPGALLILQAALDASSYSDLMAVLECFPGAVVEFTCYEHHVGVLRGRNTIVWEVRHY